MRALYDARVQIKGALFARAPLMSPRPEYALGLDRDAHHNPREHEALLVGGHTDDVPIAEVALEQL